MAPNTKPKSQPAPQISPLTHAAADGSAGADTVVVALNRATGIIFTMPDGRRVTINGNAVQLRGKAEIKLPVGAYGLTTIARADWEWIKKTYENSLPLFKSGLLFAAERKADAADMADERAELRHGLEPVDPEKTPTQPNDGKD
ncbi:MAG: hypothetical protein J1E80_07980 [Desulfovibrionaceae bacterium]|nr:hypothetical protein [Desulfovibrionaceae bacterium]